jgi:protein dithiol oxidoreductase (disulfide-forming)
MLTTTRAAEQFSEAKHFTRLQTPLTHDAGDRVDVVEFFSLACPHCADLDPYLHKWTSNRPSSVRFRRMPVPFHATWVPLSKAYLILETMKREDLVPKAFEAVHGAGAQLKDEASFLLWAEKNGLNTAAIREQWNSFDMNVKLKRAESLTKQYNVQSVPMIFVDGKFVVQSTSEASRGTVAHRDIAAVLDQMIEKAVTERKR